MGTRGPAPKRLAERLGHLTKAQKSSADVVQMSGPVRVPAASKEWHPVARRWYLALKQSGEAVYFEPSDWAAAQYVAEAMSRNLKTDRFSGQLFASVWSAMESLLTTEAARRRVRMEVQRGEPDVDEGGPTPIADYLEELRG